MVGRRPCPKRAPHAAGSAPRPPAPDAQLTGTIPSLRERAAGALIASAPGSAVLAQALGGVPMRITVPFLVLPALAALAALAFARALAFTEPAPRTRELQNLLRRGALAGILATLAYDLIRPPMRWAFGFEYDPFGAVYLFGDLMTGRPGSSLALLAGWAFHAIDGISFGIIFALMVPRGGVIPGLAAGALLQGLLMLSYPALVGVPVNDAGFLAMGIIGHAVFGTVLGATVRRSGAAGRARAPALAIATHDQV